ncbi:MAG: uroporphyrinogen-III synthase [Gemmatimonadota bacterium]
MSGPRVLLTGSRPGPVGRLLEGRGAVPLAVPTIAIRALQGDPLDGALRRAEECDWIVVTSPNGARLVLERLAELGLDTPSRPRWAAVGPRTRKTLVAAGVTIAAEPAERIGAAIPDAMGDVEGACVLLLRSAAAADDLPRLLAQRGARVEDVAAYEIVEGPEESRGPLDLALAVGLDAVVFTSGSTVRGFARLVGDPPAVLSRARVVCIGPVTARAAREAGLGRIRTATDRAPAAIVAAVVGNGG